MLLRADAPPRLWAHLTLVHDVSLKLSNAITRAWPAWTFDRALVSFGAATHDLGKALFRAELSEPGHAHEAAGERFLLENDIDPARARFARTHASWSRESSREELLVSLADKIWKGKRESELETLVIESISDATGAERWEIFERLDAVLTKLGEQADSRLEWQNGFAA
ncbi:MAG: HD domain-containing protein [Archangium sp.]|nr:HD domain-containing protein [Archangium sp.]